MKTHTPRKYHIKDPKQTQIHKKNLTFHTIIRRIKIKNFQVVSKVLMPMRFARQAYRVKNSIYIVILNIQVNNDDDEINMIEIKKKN